jgi:glycosyltransferase involved in cell wall biosynthesis
MRTSRLRILTGIDLPLAPSCGSTILCSDIYGSARASLDTTFVGLLPADPAWRHGFESTILCGVEKRPYGSDFPGYLTELTEFIEPRVRSLRPDVVHAQHLGFGLSTALASLPAQFPVVSFAHGTDIISAYESELGQRCLTLVAQRSTAIVVPTASMARELAAIAGDAITARIEVIPWGIPLRSRRRLHHPRESDQPLRLLHAGRLDCNKDSITAIRALAMTRHPARLTIIGDGPEYRNLIGAAVDLGVAERVTIKPFVSRAALWRSFADYDAFLFTTKGLEAFGMVALEAQAHGVPLIFSDIDGLAQTIGAAGLAYEPADAASLAARVDELAADSSLRVKLSEQGRANAAHYDVAHCAAQINLLTHKIVTES